MQIDTSTKDKSGGSPLPGMNKTKSKIYSEEEVKKSHCTHGPKAKCVNCLGVTKDTLKDVKPTCNHPPG